MSATGTQLSPQNVVVFSVRPIVGYSTQIAPRNLAAFRAAAGHATRLILVDPDEELVLFAAACGFCPDTIPQIAGLPKRAITLHRASTENDALLGSAALLRKMRDQMGHELAESFYPALDELEVEAQTYSQNLARTQQSLREIRESETWRLISLYRDWLARKRRQRNVFFKLFDRVTSALVTRAHRALPPVHHTDEEKLPGTFASRFKSPIDDLPAWRATFRRLALFRELSGNNQPLISVLTPCWNTPPELLVETAVSVFDQTSRGWEWILVDDGSTKTAHLPYIEALVSVCPRVRFARLEKNEGISGATNHALRMANGSYIALLDHDDILHPQALELCLDRLIAGDLDAVYSDSDKVDLMGNRDEPFYKPGWSPEYFRGVMYVGHLLCVRRELALQAGGFDSRYNGVQDFEFFLRFSERTAKIGHIPKILYHWRRAEGSVAAATSAKGDLGVLQRDAVQSHLNRINQNATANIGAVPHRITVTPSKALSQPRISILIPTKDAPEVLAKCLDSIFAKTSYLNYQVICADNGTTDKRALEIMNRSGVERLPCPGKFNFSRVNNRAAASATGEFLVFLNNDIEVISPDWLQELLYYAEQPDAGAVGALLLYPNGTVQHAGIALGFRGTADHLLRGAPGDSDGYSGSQSCAREVAAVTAACMMVRASQFHQAGGFNEHYFTAYQDVDFCLSLLAAGKRNIYTPRARLFHHESYTRRDYYDFVDRTLLLDRWQDVVDNDPYFNRNFSRNHVDYQIAPDADDGSVPPHVRLWRRRGQVSDR